MNVKTYTISSQSISSLKQAERNHPKQALALRKIGHKLVHHLEKGFFEESKGLVYYEMRAHSIWNEIYFI